MRSRAKYFVMRSLLPLALAALVMLPRLASPQFGLLDDGLTLQTGREVSGRWSSVLYLIPETGRFFPAYWLVYSLVFALVGARPLAFFVVNVLLLAGLLAMLGRIARLAGATREQAVVAAVLFAVSGPAVETFYTLSKAEPLQLTWIGLSLIATAAAVTAARPLTRVALPALAAVAVLLAHATKETSVVLVPIAVAWLTIEWWSPTRSPKWMRFAAIYVLVNLVALAAFAALRSHYAALALGEGSYTRAYVLHAVTVGPALFRICAWLVRGFAYLLPLLALAALPRAGVGGRRPIAYAGVWMAGWLAVFLPWPATFEYYLLPFTFGAALLGGALVGDAWRWRGPGQPAARRRLASFALAAAALLWLVATTNATTDARVQLAVDRANADLVDFLGGLPERSRVLANMSPANEYHYELPMHLAELKARGDIVIERMPATGNVRPDFVVTAELANQPGPTVRIALYKPRVRQDNVTLRTLVAADVAPVYRSERQARIVELGLQRLLCPLAVHPVLDVSYCPADRGVLDRRTFRYGWQVHRLVRPTAGRPT